VKEGEERPLSFSAFDVSGNVRRRKYTGTAMAIGIRPSMMKSQRQLSRPARPLS
jgi:hypothetical protein